MKIFKIHPAIGIARVGNSPEWFIGPETADEPTPPRSGYKDAECRIKKQAARFRVFQYGVGRPTEISLEDYEIKWNVSLANLRNSGYPVSPIAETIVGPNQSAIFDKVTFSTASISLGSIRTDSDGRLLILGGDGSAYPLPDGSWTDGLADGIVVAWVRYKGKVRGGAKWQKAVSSRVVVARPRFAPPVWEMISAYDVMVACFEKNAWSMGLPATPSFRKHVYPILKAGLDNGYLGRDFHQHTTFSDDKMAILATQGPATDSLRKAIFQRLKVPPGLNVDPPPDPQVANMPKLDDAPTLPLHQYVYMQKWASNNFVPDWDEPSEPMALTPPELDRGPLTYACGAPLSPGIELGVLAFDFESFQSPFRYNSPLRAVNGVKAGTLTKSLRVPWHADFPCTRYWPAYGPRFVTSKLEAQPHEWLLEAANDLPGLIEHWWRHGFVVRDAGKLVEVRRCPPSGKVKPPKKKPKSLGPFGPVQRPVDPPGPGPIQRKIKSRSR
jgi:L-Lysine epsilon oxidase N-terminal/L-lysine epsilon oxidase C-terminal domain